MVTAKLGLKSMLLRLPEGGLEQQAVEAGEIDAVIDYAGRNVILLPAARRALRERADRASGESLEAADETRIANRLLAALPRAEYQSLLAGLEPLTVRFGEVLHEPGAPIRHVYFPIDCAVALLATAGDDQALEVGLVGCEGMVGIPLALGMEVSTVRALVRSTGTAMRMNAARFQNSFQRCPLFQRGLHRYANSQLAVARQIVACNCFHALEARLARCLLMTSDRIRAEEFSLTQALLADMLGVRRGTVNEAAGPLKQRKLISYSRGTIRILDRKGLEGAACRCYARMAGF